MSLEKYVPDYEDKIAAKEMHDDASKYGVSNSMEDPANSEVDIDALKKQQEQERRAKEREQREQQKKLEQAQEQASALRHTNRQQEQQAHAPQLQNLNTAMNSGLWPPVVPEDMPDPTKNTTVKSHVGNTEMSSNRAQS